VINAERLPGTAAITMAPGTTITAGTAGVIYDLRTGAGNTNSTAGNVTLGAITANTVLGVDENKGTLTLNGQIKATAAAPNALVLSTGTFINTAGATALSTPSSQYLVYSTSPLTNTDDGIVDTNHYFGINYNQLPPNYNSADSYFLYSIVPTLTLTPAGFTTVYGTAGVAPSPAYSSTGLIDGDTVQTAASNIDFSAGTTSASNVGTYTIAQVGTVGSPEGYDIITGTAQEVITPASLVITPTGATRVYGASDPAYSATYQGLVLGQTSSVVSGLTLTSNDTPTSGVGTYQITAGLGTAQNYTITYANPGILTVTPASINIAATPVTTVYGTYPGLGYTVSGLVAGDTSSIVTGAETRTAGNNVGTYAITQGTLAAGSNYTVTYTGANYTVTPASLIIAANPASTVYGTYPGATYTPTGLTNGDTGTVITGTLSTPSGVGVGTYAIGQGTVAASSNYTVTYVANNYVVTPAPLPVNANPVTTVYGTYPAGTYTVPPAGLKNGDTSAVVTGTLATPSGAGIGTYTISQGTVGAGSNYTVVYTPNSYIITPAPLLITTGPATTTYGTTPTVPVTVTGLVNNDPSSTVTGVASVPPVTTGVGTYTIGQGTLTGSTNYTTSYVAGSVVITPAPLTIAANDATRPLGSPDPTFTATFSGLVNGESSSVVTGLQITSNDNPASLPGLYTITPANGMAANYTITYQNGTLAVTPATTPPGNPTGPITPVTPPSTPTGPVTPVTPANPNLTLAGLLASQIQGATQVADTAAVTCIKVNPDRRRTPSLQDINRTDCEAPLQIQGF
jgi:hypothetical protein